MQERENRDLLENYRSATTEAQRWETEASQRSGESSTVKIELMTRDSEMKRLREKLLLLERDVQQVVYNVKIILFVYLFIYLFITQSFLDSKKPDNKNRRWRGELSTYRGIAW